MQASDVINHDIRNVIHINDFFFLSRGLILQYECPNLPWNGMCTFRLFNIDKLHYIDICSFYKKLILIMEDEQAKTTDGEQVSD